MPALKLAVDLASWRMPLKKALPTAAELGVEGVVLDARGEIRPDQFGRTAVRQLRKMLEDLNLRVAAVSFRSRRGYATTEVLDRRVRATKEALDFAHGLGASVVLAAIGPVPPADSDARRLLVEVLADLGQHGQRAGAMLATETGGDSGPTLAGLLAELPEGALGIDFNPGSLMLGGHAPRETLEALGPQVLHVHATDATGEAATNRRRLTAVGQGAVDLPALLSALEEFGYRGYFTVQAQSPEDPVRESAAAIRHLRAF